MTTTTHVAGCTRHGLPATDANAQAGGCPCSCHRINTTCQHRRLSELTGVQCVRLDGHQGDCEFDLAAHNRSLIIAAWHEAYAEWEAGEACSPSSTDLIIIGNEIDPTRFPDPNSEQGDLLGEELFNLQCEGLELDVCFDNLFEDLR